MLTQICQYLRNWFMREIWIGSYVVAGGELTYADGTALPLIVGQYYRIVGSILNDGVHKAGDATDTLSDEPEFSGAVWSMGIPPDFLALVHDIEAWITANADAITSPLESESVGGYSRSFRTGKSESGEIVGPTWQAQFASRLAPWRKI